MRSAHHGGGVALAAAILLVASAARAASAPAEREAPAEASASGDAGRATGTAPPPAPAQAPARGPVAASGGTGSAAPSSSTGTAVTGPSATSGTTVTVPGLSATVLPPRPEIPRSDVPPLGGAMKMPSVSSEHRGLVVATGETLAIHLTMMGWNRWVGSAPWAKISGESIRRNLSSAWVRDDDDFWVNQFGHPYQGTLTYQAARSTGLPFWTSSAFPFVESALWEITGETTAPSINDQVTTSVAGVVIGEALWRVSEALRAEGGAVNTVAAAVLSPMTPLNAALGFGRGSTLAPSTRYVLAMGALAGDAPRAGWPGTGVPPRAFAGIELTWGLPGDPDLELERPFDHFVLQASYGAAADPVASVHGRGLLAGARLEPSDDVRGLWGLFLSFDFDTTGPYRVSTSGLGVGASGRAELTERLALEGTAVASAVFMGAAGQLAVVRTGPRDEVRDYRLGPGEQLLLDLRLRADPRVSGGIVLRQVLLLDTDGPGAGTESVIEASAGVLVRLHGPHGIGADASRYFRRGHDTAGAVAGGSGTAVRFYYAVMSGG